MASSSKSSQTSLFEVYLRLRPPMSQQDAVRGERFLTVEPPECQENAGDNDANFHVPVPTHITLHPPNDNKKRAVEKFAFTKVFEETSSQMDIFQDTGMGSLIKGVLLEGRDGLVATLGVTGSGKSHTILGSKSQRGIIQMGLDVIFHSLASTVKPSDVAEQSTLASIAATDPSESQIFSAQTFIEAVYGEPNGRNSRAQTPSSRSQTPLMEPMPALIFPRRHALHPPNLLPRLPDVGHLAVELNKDAEYAVLLSMYEVYNDRIFDLLSPAIVPGQGSTVSRQTPNSQKDRRRPLLFKPTEGSPDRKVVAGLRKVVCGTYEEALAVLEAGLTERKVTGTGANSVSSRSHGFFCIEVKRKVRGRRHGDDAWVGNTLTVVDLAGSERARTAKTAGATLAEAGKINESLMYLGQCLQMQSDLQDGNKTSLVPFRQCKLTELLFSNSFPSPNQTTSSSRRPQRGVMIVAADPLGDFNATSQILRYSALAKEVTVPRVPSVNETIQSSTLNSRKRPSGGSGRYSPAGVSAEELERATDQIARITAECETLAVRLAEEEISRAELELRLRATEGKCLIIEQEAREEAWAEMEERLEEERRRWQRAWAEQADRNDEHLDKKIELLSKGFQIYEDPEPSADERVVELEQENAQLRSKIAALERELMGRSPTKKSKIRNKSSEALCRESDIENALRRMDQLKLTDNTVFSPAPTGNSPVKRKQRKMATRRWDLGPEEEI
ncbi:hypothetical protein MAP00_007509 [Monascus purpureus]|nr:hypothetical protein MAP00_007509 [Monascus purpureus]